MTPLEVAEYLCAVFPLSHERRTAVHAPARPPAAEVLATETKKFRHLPISADSHEQPEPRR